MPQMIERFVQVGKYRTRYWEAGRGENLLLLHSADPGSGGALEFRNNIGPLSEQFRVVAPDLIGFGKTDSPSELLTHPAYVEHILGFMDAVDLGRTHLIGNSRGGLIGISVAGEHPAWVGRAIFAGNAGGGIPPELVQVALGPFANYVPSSDNLTAVLGRSYYSLERSVPPPVFEEYLQASIPQYEAYQRLGGYPMDVPNLKPVLASLTVPVLFVFGKEDKVFPLDQALAGFIGTPNSQFHAFSECGHHPQTERPGAFNLLARQFLSGQMD